jgi:fluoride exporter
MTIILAVALGGALGAVLRYLLNAQIMALWGGAFPIGILAVNVLGCFAMGALMGGVAAQASAEMRAFLTTGILGGFTTFSAFAHDTTILMESGRGIEAALYVAASVGLSIGAAIVGLAVGRGVAA